MKALLTAALVVMGANTALAQESGVVAKADTSTEVVRKVEIQASLHTRLTATNEEDQPAAEFGLERARIEVTWTPAKGVSGVMEAALEQVVQGSDAQRIVRDAYIEVKAAKWLRFKAGLFKKPISALENTGKGKLALVERGEVNGYLVRKLAYGSRDLGFEISGRLWKKLKLDYFLGVFNGARLPAFEQDMNGTKDVVGRLEAELFDGFRLGLNGVWKGIDTGSEYAEAKPAAGYLAGIDLRYKSGPVWLLAEGMAAKNHLAADAPWAVGAVLAASYLMHVSPAKGTWGIEPAVRLEWLKPDMEGDTQVLVASGGVNFWVASHVRLMVQGEYVMADEGLAQEWPEDWRGWLQVAFDY